MSANIFIFSIGKQRISLPLPAAISSPIFLLPPSYVFNISENSVNLSDNQGVNSTPRLYTIWPESLGSLRDYGNR